MIVSLIPEPNQETPQSEFYNPYVITTSGILTLTTDYGMQDGYVAAMKGVILEINSDIRIVDISHQISPQDVMEGAFILRNTASNFPEGTVHLAVVDPGVGTDRKAIALKYKGQIFVGPDNGLFSLLISGSDAELIVELDKTQFWNSPTPSSTFHGRDVFAPVAAHLTTGLSLSTAGTPLSNIKTMHWALPMTDDQGIQGWVVHVDRFGNCITNITKELFEKTQSGRPFKCYAGNTIIDQMSGTYGSVDRGDATLLFNSSEFVEIAIYRGSASQLFDIRKGNPVNLVFTDHKS